MKDKKLRERVESSCNWCKKDLRKQTTCWGVICEATEKPGDRTLHIRDFILPSGRHVVGWFHSRGVALQISIDIDLVFTVDCCSEECAQKLKKELEEDKHVKNIIRIVETKEGEIN